jgi:hypothetical protein
MGALPKGCTVEDVITFPEQAAEWLGQSVDWTRKRRRTLPGVINESNKVVLFHPKTYLTRRLKLSQTLALLLALLFASVAGAAETNGWNIVTNRFSVAQQVAISNMMAEVKWSATNYYTNIFRDFSVTEAKRVELGADAFTLWTKLKKYEAQGYVISKRD